MFNENVFNGAQFGAGAGDSENGFHGVGNYFFFNELILLDESVSPSVPIIRTVRLTTNVSLTISDEDALFDDRLDLIDTWTNFDGVDGDDGNVIVYFRSTLDIAVSPQVWSAWAPFHVAEIRAMGVEFKADLISNDSSVNVLINNLEILVDEVV